MLDHLVLATPDLDATSVAVTRDGITLVDGGPHIGVGTRNRLAGLGPGRYLEVVGPDPEQPEPDAPRPFHIDELTDARLVTWAVRVPDLDAALEAARGTGHDPGVARAMSRRRPDGELLAWRLAFPPDDLGGVMPFLIDWGTTAHPSASLPGGATLDELVLEHPEPARVRAVLDAVGADGPVVVRAGETPALTARIDGRVLG
ncbi:VOC family protein [Pseudonocardia endophytica]|uniref:Glyoxalase-like protein n=1 Tax=Pseudonocardia endophytica TaxID=401976 RepID=A0A4R1HHY0_PSEEN|nr:VOC family protein [Pseudonocardia endophytica]TCK21864.1 glyoxalase-like protein [Pseudonocardia endophytica]